MDVTEQELDAAKAKAAALAAAAAARAELATMKRQRRETIEREIERLQAARDAGRNRTPSIRADAASIIRS